MEGNYFVAILFAIGETFDELDAGNVMEYPIHLAINAFQYG